MDAPIEPIRGSPSAQTANGGSVSPLDRLAAVKAALPSTNPIASRERYELRDPFAEVTYRTTSLLDAITRANQLGSDRFVAIGPDGQRTTLTRVEGEWRRGTPRPALRRADLSDER